MGSTGSGTGATGRSRPVLMPNPAAVLVLTLELVALGCIIMN